MAIAADIHEKRTARRLEGNTEKWAAGGSEIIAR
jgi:hypothetical protein